MDSWASMSDYIILANGTYLKISYCTLSDTPHVYMKLPAIAPLSLQTIPSPDTRMFLAARSRWMYDLNMRCTMPRAHSATLSQAPKDQMMVNCREDNRVIN